MSKFKPGTVVRVIRSHHNMNDGCVGKLGTIDKIIMTNNIFRVKIEGLFWLFGKRDLKIVSTYEMLGWEAR